MKKLFLAAVAVMMTAFSVNAQVKVVSPHPDLDIKITRCAIADGTVIIDMVFTNFGPDETIGVYGTGYMNATAYDDEGNVYNRENSKISIGSLGQGHNHYGNDVTLPQDIPLKIRAQVEKVSSNATKLALIKFPVSSKGAMRLENKFIQIRNLEWVK